MPPAVPWCRPLFAASCRGLAAGQVGSPAGPVPVEYLTARRADLLKRMGNGIAIIRSSEQRSIEGDYPQDSDYRENNDFFYLTGLESPSSWLVLVARDTLAPQVYLYLPARDTLAERWTGPRLGPGPEAVALTGIDEIRPADQAQKQIRSFVRVSTSRGGKLYLLLGEGGRLRLLLHAAGARQRVRCDRPPPVAGGDAAGQGRGRNAPPANGHRDQRQGPPRGDARGPSGGLGVRAGGWRRGDLPEPRGGTGGYPSIVGSGLNGTTLHYDKSRGQLQAGELVVMDMGAEWGYYAADVTRTIPGPASSRRASWHLQPRARHAAGRDGLGPARHHPRPARPDLPRLHEGPLRRPLRSRHLRPVLHPRAEPLDRHGRARRRQLCHAAGPEHGLHGGAGHLHSRRKARGPHRGRRGRDADRATSSSPAVLPGPRRTSRRR